MATSSRLDRNIVPPGGNTHDGNDDLDRSRKVLQVLGFVRRAQNIGIGGIGLLRRHLVGEAGVLHERGHLGASAQLVDESSVQPGLVNLEGGIHQQAVAIEPLDVIAFESGSVAPDVDVVFLHGRDQHGARNGAADGRGIEVGDSRSGDVKSAGLQRGDAFANKLACGNRSGAPFPRRIRAPCAVSHRSRFHPAGRDSLCTRTG